MNMYCRYVCIFTQCVDEQSHTRIGQHECTSETNSYFYYSSYINNIYDVKKKKEDDEETSLMMNEIE
jgi:hypothetical protein